MTTPLPLVYSCKEAAARLGNGVVTEATLARLARERTVTHTRIGRKVGWTDEQLCGAVEYLATRSPSLPPKRARESRKHESPPAAPIGAIPPIESRPGTRYGSLYPR